MQGGGSSESSMAAGVTLAWGCVGVHQAEQQFFLSLAVSLTPSHGTQVQSSSTSTPWKKSNLRRHRWNQAEGVSWSRSQAWRELRSFRLAPPASSGYLEQIHGVGKPDPAEGRSSRCRREAGVEAVQGQGSPQQPLLGTAFAQIPLY